MQRRGHRVWLACCRGSRLEKEANATGLSALPVNVTGYFHPLVAWQLSRSLNRFSVDVIHCQISKDIATVVPAMRLCDRRIPIALSKRVGSYIGKRDILHRFTYAHVSRVLAVSSVIHKNVLDTTPVTPDRVLTIHDAVDTEQFSLKQVNRSRVRREFGFGDETILVGFVGRFSPGKGHEEFIEAADLLRRKHRNVHFLIVGEASHGEQQYEQTIKAMCVTRELQRVVTFAGFRKDIPDVMAAFDIFAFPSHAESFGVVLIEAMAMERPVVSTNCDGVLDIVVNEETGLYVHPRRSAELAGALSTLIEDPTLRDKMGKAGRKRVEEMFDQKRQTEKLEDVYFSLLEGSA